MRLIDADVLRDLIDGGYDIDFSETPELKRELLNTVDYQETIDAVPVVRCGECKYGIMWDGKLSCEWHGFYSTENDWYCADGERKDGAE